MIILRCRYVLSNGKARFGISKTKDTVDSPTSELMNTGLTSAEAEKKLKQYGYNEVAEKKPNPAGQFARKFWGLSAWMLEAIIILSYFLQRYADMYIILGLLVFNAVLSFIEEQQASGVVEALKEKLRVNARVLRDGTWSARPARELVPGDVVRIRQGDFVPADVKIAQGILEIDQSALTGESMTVEKKPGDLLYSGSIVKRGESSGVVASTGTKTYFGRTAQLVQLAKPKLHIESVTANVVRWLLVISISLIAVAFVVSAARGFNLLDVLPIALVVLLSAIPVALPVMFTVTMALGAKELARKGVLVTRLSAAEDAATMDTLCVDKTGTITVNRLSIAKVIPQQGFIENDVVLYGALASQEANQDPIDLAFINFAKQRNLSVEEFVQKTFVPFDPATRKTESTIQKGDIEFKVAKGAVKTIAGACGLSDTETKRLEAELTEYATKGYRAIAVAKTDAQGRFRLIGLAVLYDPPRADSKQLISELRELSVSVKMLTGDALPIAKEIAKDVSLSENIITASELKACLQEDALEAQQEAEDSDGFAEIFPEDKYTIVKSLQIRRHIVGMTGDGVNDAPALRQAEVGIAVSNATDVAKGAASVVLVNEGLTSIIDLVKNGRIIYERVHAWILSKIVRTLQISMFVVLSFLLTGNYVVSAFAIIVYFFLTDFVKIALSTDNFTGSKQPDTWDISGAVKASIILGVLVIVESLALLYFALTVFQVALTDPTLYTLTFEILFYSALLLVFNVRERRHFWHSIPSHTLFAAIVSSILIGTVMVSIGIPNMPAVPLWETLLVFVFSALFAFVVNDAVKAFFVEKFKLRL
jgi:H+-transporting ATPase